MTIDLTCASRTWCGCGALLSCSCGRSYEHANCPNLIIMSTEPEMDKDRFDAMIRRLDAFGEPARDPLIDLSLFTETFFHELASSEDE